MPYSVACSCPFCYVAFGSSSYNHRETLQPNPFWDNIPEPETQPANTRGIDRPTTYGGLLPYDYRPVLNFNGTGPVFLGMELEASCDHTDRAVELVNATAPDLLYMKSDGSVDGFEMCAHPMTMDWAMANFPWDLLPELEEVPSWIETDGNGIHIHVSRRAFSGPAHMYNWMKLFYRNADDVQRIAGRESGSWSSFDNAHRRAQYFHCKKKRSTSDMDRDRTTNRRYSAINTINRATLEVRVFASSLHPPTVKSHFQFMDASVEYARILKASSVVKDNGWDWSRFVAWANAQDKYDLFVKRNHGAL